ncbi:MULTISPECIES: class I SAM-dependent methyltransferase [Actinosynnema]|uniref:SAM-dependent methyltransferase n=1 Tax=Actinosynnema TaxID=40566 RepID=UPI0020A30E42|nr:class I SAM-dependent methyltransferase [Actinosynnema pretiosum]MCP2093447.1 Methyltransferase domain-containing protein [Actinosynnema pretiosum]
MTTPLRDLDLPERSGCLLLGDDTGVAYLDGAEELVHAIVSQAGDLGSLSDELHHAGRTWAEQYHMDRGRANVLRALALPPEASVLEIGAGCGAITRYLGEVVAAVDAVEPVEARARVAAQRVRDLPSARVFVGGLEDVPEEPAYDLALSIGVLEYVGSGSRDDGPYLDFLTALRRRLRPGGALVLAIENQLGVKYLAGAPEDHSGRPWDGPEGYPHGSPARTFARKPLEALLRAAGFEVARTLGCFPDYKITRVVLADELVDRHPGLVTALPSFPSPDWGSSVERVADEARMWEQLVNAGLAGEAVNSFLVIATNGEPGVTPWPTGRLASYFSTDRAARWCTAAEVLPDRISKSPMLPQGGDPVSVRGYDEQVHRGAPLLSLLSDEPWRVEELLVLWRDLLAARAADLGPAIWDLVPHNVVVTEEGPRAIDLEWQVEGADPIAVEQRGLLLTADHLARTGWSGAGERTSVRDLASWLGVLLGYAPTYVDEAAEREARFQAARICGGSTGAGLRREQDYLRAAWHTRLTELVAG